MAGNASNGASAFTRITAQTAAARLTNSTSSTIQGQARPTARKASARPTHKVIQAVANRIAASRPSATICPSAFEARLSSSDSRWTRSVSSPGRSAKSAPTALGSDTTSSGGAGGGVGASSTMGGDQRSLLEVILARITPSARAVPIAASGCSRTAVRRLSVHSSFRSAAWSARCLSVSAASL